MDRHQLQDLYEAYVNVYEKKGEEDHEVSMIRAQLHSIMKSCETLMDHMKGGEKDVEAWVQAKITKAEGMLQAAANYIESGESTASESYELFSEAKNRRPQIASKKRKEFNQPQEKPEGPRAFVTAGLPGSGKSTIAKHMRSKSETDQHELDKSRRALGKSPAYFGQDIVQHTYGGAKKSFEQGRNTVLSNTSIPKPHRDAAIKNLQDIGYQDVRAVLSPGSTKAAMRRNRRRTGTEPGEGAVPQNVMNRMAQGMASMSRDEKRNLRDNYKDLHKEFRFTKPAMKRSGSIR